MRVFLDEQLCETAADSVAKAIASAAALAEKQGRMVVEVMVDGDCWTDEQIAAASSSDTGAEEVKLRTAVPAQLVCQVLRDAEAVLAEADYLQEKAAELIESGQQEEARERLNEALTIWVNVQQAISMSSEIMGWNLEQETGGPDSPAAIIDNLNGHLKLLRQALEANDPVGLIDSLRFDFPEVISRWRKLLSDLAERAEERG